MHLYILLMAALDYLQIPGIQVIPLMMVEYNIRKQS